MKSTTSSWPLTLTLSLLGKKVLLPVVLLRPVAFSWPAILCWTERAKRWTCWQTHWHVLRRGQLRCSQGPAAPRSIIAPANGLSWHVAAVSLSLSDGLEATRGNTSRESLNRWTGSCSRDGSGWWVISPELFAGELRLSPPLFFNGLSFQSFFRCLFPSSLVIHHSLLTNYHGKLHPRQHGRSLTCVYVENTTSSRR